MYRPILSYLMLMFNSFSVFKIMSSFRCCVTIIHGNLLQFSWSFWQISSADNFVIMHFWVRLQVVEKNIFVDNTAQFFKNFQSPFWKYTKVLHTSMILLMQGMKVWSNRICIFDFFIVIAGYLFEIRNLNMQ